MTGTGVNTVVQEAAVVVSEMRRNTQWKSSGMQNPYDSPLLRGFRVMRDQLLNVTDITTVDAMLYLKPFLETIRYGNTTGPITGAALSAVNKFIKYGFLTSTAPNVEVAVGQIAAAVVECRFDPISASADEVVLLMILQTLNTLLTTDPCGRMLSDELVCQILQTCFRMAFNPGISDLLRHSAETTLIDMILCLFSNLQDRFNSGELRAQVVDALASARSGGKRSSGDFVLVNELIESGLMPDGGRDGGGVDSPASEARRTSITVDGGAKVPALEAVTTAAAETNKGKDGGGGDGDDGAESDSSSSSSSSTSGSSSYTSSGGTTEASNTNDKDGGHASATRTAAAAANAGATATDVAGDEGASSTILGVTGITQPQHASDDDDDAYEDRGTVETDVSEISLSHVRRPQVNGPGGPTPPGFVNPHGIRFLETVEIKDIPIPKPYSITGIQEVFRFLLSLVNPDDSQNTPTMRGMGLTLINVALDRGGPAIAAFEPLLDKVERQLMRYVFQIIHSTQGDSSLLALALRSLFSVYMCEELRSALKGPLEAMLDAVIANLERKEMSYDIHELILELIVELCRQAFFAVELYSNYDCDPYCGNLFERLVKFLSKSAFPVAGDLYTVHLLSLDALLAIVATMAERCVPLTDEDRDWARRHATAKQHKSLLQKAADEFDKKPRKGIEFLLANGLVSEGDARAVALFLRNAPVAKKQVGEYISEEAEFQQNVLKEYLSTFDFTGLRIDEAMRVFLEAFLIPGEAQRVGRVMEKFALQLFDQSPSVFADADAAEVLAFAVMMLHTNIHNPNVLARDKMSVESFAKTVKGVNGGGNFPLSFLEEIFSGIEGKEIKLLGDQGTTEVTDRRWGDVVKRTERLVPYDCNHCGGNDRAMFSLTWGPTVTAISVIFESADDDAVLHKAIDGFYSCAQISAHYNNTVVFDNLVINLCRAALLDEPDDLITSFGQNLKAQMAAITVFAITRQYGDHLEEGWRKLLSCILCLFRAGVLPEHVADAHGGFLPPRTRFVIPRPTVVKASSSAGIFATLTSYITPADVPSPESDAARAEAERHVRECVTKCRIDELFSESKFLQAESLRYFVSALILEATAALDGTGGGSSRPGSSAGGSATELNTSGASVGSPVVNRRGGVSVAETVAVFCLERVVDIAILNRDRIGVVWHLTSDYIRTILGTAERPSFVVQRAVVGLQRLAERLLSNEDLDPLIAESILTAESLLINVPDSVWNSVADEALAGLRETLLQSAGTIQSQSAWETVFGLIRKAVTHPTASEWGFKALREIALDANSISINNFDACLAAVQDFVLQGGSSEARIVSALEMLWVLENRVAGFIPAAEAAIGTREVGDRLGYFRPLFKVMAVCCRHPIAVARHRGLSVLERGLLVADVVECLSGGDLVRVIQQVLFPLLSDLLKPFDSRHATYSEVEETRIRAAALLTKVYLAYLNKLKNENDFHLLWLNVLRFMEEYVKNGKSGTGIVAEAVSESVRNMLLVMASDSEFGDPAGGEDGSIWQVTWEAVESFIPDMKATILASLSGGGGAGGGAGGGGAADGTPDYLRRLDPDAQAGSASPLPSSPSPVVGNGVPSGPGAVSPVPTTVELAKENALGRGSPVMSSV